MFCNTIVPFRVESIRVTHKWPILWSVISSAGLLGFGLSFVGLVILAYAAISHVSGTGRKVRWQWHTGIVLLSLRLFVGGLILQLVSFVGRLALGGS